MNTMNINEQNENKIARWVGKHPMVIAMVATAVLAYVVFTGLNIVQTNITTDAYGIQSTASIR